MNVHVKTEMRDHHAGKQPDSATSVEDGMHSTSDFVKKLFKYVPFVIQNVSQNSTNLECSKILRSNTSCHGDPTEIASWSKT